MTESLSPVDETPLNDVLSSLGHFVRECASQGLDIDLLTVSAADPQEQNFRTFLFTYENQSVIVKFPLCSPEAMRYTGQRGQLPSSNVGNVGTPAIQTWRGKVADLSSILDKNETYMVYLLYGQNRKTPIASD